MIQYVLFLNISDRPCQPLYTAKPSGVSHLPKITQCSISLTSQDRHPPSPNLSKSTSAFLRFPLQQQVRGKQGHNLKAFHPLTLLAASPPHHNNIRYCGKAQLLHHCDHAARMQQPQCQYRGEFASNNLHKYKSHYLQRYSSHNMYKHV